MYIYIYTYNYVYMYICLTKYYKWYELISKALRSLFSLLIPYLAYQIILYSKVMINKTYNQSTNIATLYF